MTDLVPGMFVGDHELIELAGAGGFSVVWKARRQGSGELHAIKLPRVESFLDHLRREAELSTLISDTQVVPILETRLDDETPHLVLPWVEAGRAAKSAGRLRYALKCAIAAGDEAQVTELKAQLGIVDRVVDAARPEDAKVGVKTASGVAAAVGGEHSASGEGPIPTDKPPPSTGPTLV